VVFSAKIGIYVKGAANLLYNDHTWNDATGNGGTGILLDCAGYTQNRVIASYLDGNHLIATDPEHLLINECFFLGPAAIAITSTTGNHVINGLTISGNEWDGGSGHDPTIYLDESATPFTGLIDTYINENMFGGGYDSASTQAHAALTMKNSSTFCFDLTAVLLFAQFPLTHIQVTLAADAVSNQGLGVSYYVNRGMKAASVPPNDQRSVCVVINQAVTGTMYLDVDQSTRSWGNQVGNGTGTRTTDNTATITTNTQIRYNNNQQQRKRKSVLFA